MSDVFIEIGKDVINARSIKYISSDAYCGISIHVGETESLEYEFNSSEQRDEKFKSLRKRLGLHNVS